MPTAATLLAVLGRSGMMTSSTVVTGAGAAGPESVAVVGDGVERRWARVRWRGATTAGPRGEAGAICSVSSSRSR
jgi:hypothetical protein